MIKTYFKQAWAMMKQNRLFSSMYILGTAITVALVMILFIILYIKLGPVYPEYNRDRMVYLENIYFNINNGNNSGSTGVSREVLLRLARDVDNFEQMAISSIDTHSKGMIEGVKRSDPMFTCNNFWNLYDFEFICGKGYTLEQVNNNRVKPVVVLCESLCRKLFATTDAVGKTVKIKDIEHKVVGVVKDVSGSTPNVYAQYWVPVNTPLSSEGKRGGENMLGNYKTVFLAKDKGSVADVKKQISEVLTRMMSEQPEGNRYEPMILAHDEYVLGYEYEESIGNILLIFLTLLFVPALNLCGMIASRMNSRLEEIGVRKAFGATNRQLVFQVLCENLLFTATGALLGFVLSCIFAKLSQEWIVTLLDSYVDIDAPTTVSMEMMLNPTILSITVLLVFILNIVSALVPTIYSLRHSITVSLNVKK